MLVPRSFRILIGMIPKSKNFFKAVSEPDKRKQLFLAMAKDPPIILCKTKSQSIFYLEFVRLDESEKMILKPLSKILKAKLLSDAEANIEDIPIEVIAQFDLNEEKYFFIADAIRLGTRFKFLMNNDIFILQRRQNFRMKIPIDFKSTATILHSEVGLMGADSVDLSARGCRLMVADVRPNFKVGDPFEVNLSFPKRKKLKIPSYLRHYIKKENGLELGFEFHKPSPEIEKDLFGIMMEIYRDYLSKLKD